METLPGRSQTIANDPDDRDDHDRPDRTVFYPDDRSRSGRSWKIRSDQMETLSDDRDDRDDRSLSQKASFPSPFFALSREDCLGVREFSPKWRQRRSSTLLYLWKRYRNTSACTTNFQNVLMYDKLLTLLSFDRSAESKICAFVVLFYLFYGAKLKE